MNLLLCPELWCVTEIRHFMGWQHSQYGKYCSHNYYIVSAYDNTLTLLRSVEERRQTLFTQFCFPTMLAEVLYRSFTSIYFIGFQEKFHKDKYDGNASRLCWFDLTQVGSAHMMCRTTPPEKLWVVVEPSTLNMFQANIDAYTIYGSY